MKSFKLVSEQTCGLPPPTAVARVERSIDPILDSMSCLVTKQVKQTLAALRFLSSRDYCVHCGCDLAVNAVAQNLALQLPAYLAFHAMQRTHARTGRPFSSTALA